MLSESTGLGGGEGLSGVQSSQNEKPSSFSCNNLGNWLVLNALYQPGLVRLKQSPLSLHAQLLGVGAPQPSSQ